MGWLFEDDIITDDSRVTIDTSNNYFIDRSVDAIIQFNPMIEEDEGNQYICYGVINGSFIYKPIDLQMFTGKLQLYST